MTLKMQLDEVKKIFASYQCEFLDDEYISSNYPHNYRCRCGKEYKKRLTNLKTSWRCDRCRYEASVNSKRYSLEEVKQYFSDHGCQFLDDWYIDNRQLHNYICKCGRQGTIRFCNFYKGKRCTDCAGNTKLKFEDIENMFQYAGCKLISTSYEGALVPLEYVCVCGHVAKTQVRHFRNGRRCLNCSSTFNRDLPSYLYLISNKNLIKIGIYNQGSHRLKEHKKNKQFILLDQIGPLSGHFVESMEKTILNCLDMKGIARGKVLFEEKFDGYTECWRKEDFDVSSLRELWEKI